MGLKFSNAIGAPFRNFVSVQLKLRAQKSSTDDRSIRDVLYLANKNAWVRLQSSVEIGTEYKDSLNEYYNQREGAIDGYTYVDIGTTAAKNWVLQSGTSKVSENKITLRSELGTDGAYGLGGIKDQGYRPMPGLDSVTVETAGRLGSLRYATINFKVWNMSQLDLIDALYFRLGFTMLLEWGHVQYYTNDELYQTDATGIGEFFEAGVTKEKIILEINKKIEDSCGNYDGMLGTVTNFNYSMNQEGGWDCSMKLIGLGSLLETQRINSIYTLPDKLANNYLKWRKDEVDRQNAVIASNNAKAQRDANNQAKADAKSKYDAEVKAFNDRHPITDVASFYFNTNKATLNLSDFGNQERLYSRTIVSPNKVFFTNEIKKDPKDQPIWDYLTIAGLFNKLFGDESSKSPIKILIDSTGRRNGYYTAGYIDTNNQVHPGWINQGEGNDKSGFIYPLALGNTYELDLDLLRYVINKPAGIGYHPITPLLQEAATLRLSSRRFGSGDLLTITRPTDGLAGGAKFSRNVQVTFVHGATTTYTQKVGSWITRARIVSIVGTEWETAKKIGYTWLGTLTESDLVSYIDKALVNGKEWELTNIKTETLSNDASGLGVAGNLLRVNLQYAATVTNLQLYKDEYGKIPYSVLIPVTFVVEIETEVPTILSKLVKLKAPDPIPVLGQPQQVQVPQQALINVAKEDQGLSTFNSALEAMLTLVQYQSVSNYKSKNEVVVVPIKDITGEIIKSLPAAPLSQIFDANGGPKPEVPSKPNYYTDPYYLGLKGYCTALMSNQVNTNNVTNTPVDAYTVTPTASFDDIMYSYMLPKTYQDSEESGGLSSELRPVYVKLGYLLFFINNVCLLYDSTKPDKGSTAARPHFYIDFNPETNYCFTAPYQLSTNPQVCLVPWNGTQEDYKDIFIKNGTEPPSKDLFDFSDKTTGDMVSAAISQHGAFKSDPTDPTGKYRGRTMNILVNTQYLLDVLRDSTNRDGHADVYFKPFMDRVLQDINKSLGDINAFRLGYIDSSNTTVVLDDQFVPVPANEENILRADISLIDPMGRAIVPIFGKNSIARSLDFQTNITTKMSSLIAIGARGNTNTTGSTQSSDASSFHWLNVGLKDRIISEAQDISKVQSTPPQTKSVKASKIALANNFNEYIKSIYGRKATIDKAAAAPMTNYYMQATTEKKAVDPASTGAPVIPLNLSFSTDGISGINMGNVFLIPEEKLPISLRALGDGYPRFGYMVMGLNHQLQNNQWITDVRGQIIRLRPGESYAQGGAVAQTKGGVAITNQKTALPGPTDPSKCKGQVGGYAGAYPYVNAKNTGYNYSIEQVPYGQAVTTANVKTYYPTINFASVKPGPSDIKVSNPLTDSEIVDMTDCNPFLLGVFTNKLKGFIIHHTAGSVNSSAYSVGAVFRGRGYPAQYVITGDGRIYRFIPDGARGAHILNGSGVGAGLNNSNTIGVEVCAANDSQVTQAQVEAVARLANYLGFSKNQIFGHGEVNPGHRDISEGRTAKNYIQTNC